MHTFVGRSRELAWLRRMLAEGHSVVITGPFGSGRTALVRQLASEARGYRFVHLHEGQSRRHMRATLCAARMMGGPVVAVLDDVGRLTPARRRFLRDITSEPGQSCIVVADGCLGARALVQLRAALGAAPVIGLGPLSMRAAETFVAAEVRRRRLAWSPADIRASARSAHGVPLLLRLMMETASQRRDAGS